ncbi:hypothetical protein [Marinirhabdus gelatinilytica]|uniref:SGNH/GDSL hydrolase family protein n=1 Tax=Marinirhabdus gelatinilytica TaxID=1703343 RepID=A0A370Q8Y5_9FLAO|nr:hypothetical protein [Marinirhabdus gelatinilytica]RDK84825.1 hypothetical protein C8D94_104198 [Marinirhabdus gelatinilytica]
MKPFVKYIVILLAITLSGMLVLDLFYTVVFNTGAYRNKLMWVRDLENRPQLDYIILGSSRANYTLKPNLIEAQTGKEGYNLGMNSCNIIETQALLEEFLQHGDTKAVYVQVDSQYRQDFPDPIGEVVWMPYINEAGVYEHFEDFGSKYKAYRYIPFYRYQKFGGRLGLREVFSSLFGTGYNYNSTKGYMPRYGVLEGEKDFIPDVPLVAENLYYTNLVRYCKERDIELYFFTAPYYKFEGDIEKLDTFLPNYTNFSDSLKQPSYFSDQIHLNTKGAKRFTEIFMETYFSETP